MERRRLHRAAPQKEERMHRFLRPGGASRGSGTRGSSPVGSGSAAAGTRLLPTSLPPAPTPPQVVAEQQQGGAPHFVVPARGLGGAGEIVNYPNPNDNSHNDYTWRD
ncbi:hypothetical protein OsJ_05501 [Oryza sativa Japonica Group]|uniref:Uncharacterized protein n=1 Tax=Oryza sativa subsp. japonica TaxID=39947 RepID=A3A3G5_ORYSJ|nr:hypothetical protein OsJ_05501 [Oryza sativa Japonica Group]